MENRTGRNESHKKELPKELLKESSQKYNLPDSLLEEVREIRQYLHTNPELSGKEYKTTEFIKKFLTEHNIKILPFTLKTGVIAEIGEGEKMKKRTLLFLVLTSMLLIGVNGYSMHIMEGFLPLNWVMVWFAVCIPFWIIGIKKLQAVSKGSVQDKMTLALAGAFIFVLSALKIPSVTGSSSHPTGVGLSTILYGPFVTSILGTIVLIFQAGLLAHGGFTTLGANAVSMAIAGPIVSYLVYKGFEKKNKALAVFLAAALGDLATYVVTSIQLALAYPSPQGGVVASFIKFGAVFAVTQVPLAVIEGLLTNVVMNILEKYGLLFYQDNQETNSEQGNHFGIGLAFVNRVAKIHGGEVKLSNFENGALVTISIPV